MKRSGTHITIVLIIQILSGCRAQSTASRFPYNIYQKTDSLTKSLINDPDAIRFNSADNIKLLSAQSMNNGYAQKLISKTNEAFRDTSEKIKKFELRWNDAAVAGGKRSELVYNSVSSQERWYLFSTYLEDFISDPYSVVIFQLHGVPDKDEAFREPNIALAIKNNNYGSKK